jgi:hypothetical protein
MVIAEDSGVAKIGSLKGIGAKDTSDANIPMFVAAPIERLPKYLKSSIHTLSILRRLNVQLLFSTQVTNIEIKIDTARVAISGVESTNTPR